ncbi:MAG: hypothetical protein ABSA83_09070 [Verrucomicrobiota bacterium]|jgi:hypothetical protein
MKLYSLSVQISAGAALTLLACGVSSGHAAAVPLQNTDASAVQCVPFQQIKWEQARIDKLEHAYHLLEGAKADYHGHRVEAMHAIKKAGEVLGVEFHGKDHVEEAQWKSDRRLQEAKRLLQDLVVESKAVEQPHIHRAVNEIDKALAVK